MSECLSWKNPHPLAAYIGSAGLGLGFYHIDFPKSETTGWLNISNCGIVEIGKGKISLHELERERESYLIFSVMIGPDR
jgi:hypothetical protein